MHPLWVSLCFIDRFICVIFYFIFYWVLLIYNVVPICYTATWLSYTCVYFFNTLFHYGLSQDIEYSSLCYTIGPYCLSTLYAPVCNKKIPNSQSNPLPPTAALANTSLFSMSLILFIHFCNTLDSTYMYYHMIFAFLCMTYFT